jgi:hypothetical protein
VQTAETLGDLGMPRRGARARRREGHVALRRTALRRRADAAVFAQAAARWRTSPITGARRWRRVRPSPGRGDLPSRPTGRRVVATGLQAWRARSDRTRLPPRRARCSPT